MTQDRQKIVAWVSSNILPHERDVRAWLRRHGVAADRVDDVVQEAYCRIAALETVDNIANGRAYLFCTVKNLMLEDIRRARIVRIETVAEIELWNIVDDGPSPERVAAGRLELQRVEALISALPERCRRIFELRRKMSVPQREIAKMLGVSENTVEAQSARGLKLVLKALADEVTEKGPKGRESVNRKRERKGT